VGLRGALTTSRGFEKNKLSGGRKRGQLGARRKNREDNWKGLKRSTVKGETLLESAGTRGGKTEKQTRFEKAEHITQDAVSGILGGKGPS